MKRTLPIFAVLTAALLSYSLYEALVLAPTDQLQGDVYRIIYYHVPSAWTAFLLFGINFVCSIQYLVRGNPRSDRLTNWIVVGVGVVIAVAAYVVTLPKGMLPSAVATTGLLIVGLYFLVKKLFSHQAVDVLAVVSAEVGVVFCTVVLVTGPLWARPVWGIWWASGDIRLTSTLVMWLIYVSYLLLRKFSNSGNTPTIAAALAVFGALDVPLVYFSIWFFRTQHPQPIIGGEGSIDPVMLRIMTLNWCAFLCLAALVCWSRYHLECLQREVDEAQAMQSLLEPRSSR